MFTLAEETPLTRVLKRDKRSVDEAELRWPDDVGTAPAHFTSMCLKDSQRPKVSTSFKDTSRHITCFIVILCGSIGSSLALRSTPDAKA